MARSAAFTAAAEHAKTLKPDNNAKLRLYGAYKQATAGDCDSAEEPSWLKPVEHAKWKAWEAMRGTSAREAEEKYIALVAGLDPGFEPPRDQGSESDNREGVDSKHAGTNRDSRRESGEWETVWRLSSCKERRVFVDHVSLTRFDPDSSQVVCNLPAGKYIMYTYTFRGANGLDSAVGAAASPATSPKSPRKDSAGQRPQSTGGNQVTTAFRNVLKTATFGKLGNLAAQVEWCVYRGASAAESNAVIVQEALLLNLGDNPAGSVAFEIEPGQAPATAVFSVSSTSTVTVLSVAAQLYRSMEHSDAVAMSSGYSLNLGDEASEERFQAGPHRATDEVLTAVSGTRMPETPVLGAIVFLGCALGLSPASTSYLALCMLGLVVVVFGSEPLARQFAPGGKLKVD